MPRDHRRPPAELIIQQPDKTEKRFVRSSRDDNKERARGSAGDANDDELARLVMGCPPYTASFNDLLTNTEVAASAHDQRRLAVLVRARMHSEFIPLNTITYNALIQLVIDSGDDIIFDLYEEFKDVSLHENNSVQPDLTTFQNLFRACERSSLFQRAFALYRQMHDLFHIMPGVAVYNTLLGFCTASKDVAQATHLVSEMNANGVTLDINTYNSLFTVLVNTAPYTEMLRLFSEMTDRGLRPTIRIFNTMLAAARVENDYDGAFELFEEMKKKGILPDLTTYNNLLCSCEQRLDTILGEGRYARVRRSHAQRLHGSKAMTELVLALLTQMRAMGEQPNTFTYNKVLNILLRCRDRRIFAVFDDVQLAYDRCAETTDCAARARAAATTIPTTKTTTRTTTTSRARKMHDVTAMVVSSLCAPSRQHTYAGDSNNAASAVDSARSVVHTARACSTFDRPGRTTSSAGTNSNTSASELCGESGSKDGERVNHTTATSCTIRSIGSISTGGVSITSGSDCDCDCASVTTLNCLHSVSRECRDGDDADPAHLSHRSNSAKCTSRATSAASLRNSDTTDEDVSSSGRRRTQDTQLHAEADATRSSLGEGFIGGDSPDCRSYHARLLASLNGESEMQVRGVQPTVDTYCCIMKAYLAVNQVGACRALYTTMRKTHKLLLDRAVVMVVLEACARNGGDSVWAESVMQSIRKQELFVDTSMYNMYLRVLAAQIGEGTCLGEGGTASLLAELRERFAEMKSGMNEFGAWVDCETCNVMLCVYTQVHRYDDALQLFVTMCEPYSAIKPNDETYCCIIALAEARRERVDVEFLMNYMYSVSSGKEQALPKSRCDAVSLSCATRVGITVFHRLMQLYAFFDDVRQIEEVFTLLKRCAIDDNHSSHDGSTQDNMCGGGDGHRNRSATASGSIETAVGSQLETRSHSRWGACSHSVCTLPPVDVTCYNIMMQFYLAHAQYDHVRSLFRELRSDHRLEPDRTMYSTMFTLYNKLDDRKSIVDLFEETHIHEVSLDRGTYEVIMQPFIPTTDPFLYDVLDDMSANGVKPEESTFALFLVSNEGRQKLADILARKMFSQCVETSQF